MTSNEDEQFDCTIPSLVSDVVLAHMRDVKLLKTCRLVCTSWNIVACRSLRTCSLVRVTEGAPRLTDLTAVLLRRSFGALKDLPSPFQNVHVEGNTFTDPTFVNLVLLPNIAITSLTFKLPDRENKLDQSQLGRIFEANKATIKNLRILGMAGFQLNETLSLNDKIQLLALKNLDFTDICNKCTHIPLMKNILSVCKPKIINLNIGDGNLLVSLLTQDKVENLKTLTLTFGNISTIAWKHLGILKFSKLRKLVLNLRYPENNEPDHQQLYSFCQNVSPYLEDLTTNARISNESGLKFPHLKTMNLWGMNPLYDFTQDRFPSLKNLTYNVRIPLLTIMEKDSVIHEGVTSVSINLNGESLTSPSFDQVLMIFLTHLSRQFPKINSLGFYMDKFHSITLTDVCEFFPNLTRLKLGGDCDFFSFTGIDITMLRSYLELGRPIEKIPRRKSILDLKDLQFLACASKFIVTPDMIMHCLPRIPKLKVFALFWNDSLSASLLRDSVGHLEKIVIMNSTQSQYRNAMTEVSVLPNVHMM